MSVRLTRLGSFVAGVSLAAAAVVANGPANVGTPDVPEGSPGFNCWTMGNRVCGASLTYVEGADGARGAVLAKGDDGVVRVAWTDGVVSVATRWEREAAWQQCVRTADGGDASLFACDDAWMADGDVFSM